MPAHFATSDRDTQALSEEPALVPRQRPTLGRVVEVYAPAFIGAGAAFLGWRFGWLHILTVSWAPNFLDKILVATSIFVAYLLGVIAILPAVGDKEIMRRFREWGYFVQLVRYLGQAIWSSLFLLVLTLLVFALPFGATRKPTLDGIYSALWWGTLGYVAAAVIRATNLMLKILAAR